MKVKFNIRADTPNKNGVIFPQQVLEEAIDKYKQREYKFGTLKYNPSGSELRLSDVAFELKTIEKENDTFVGELEILDTPAGRQLREKIEGRQDEYRICTMIIGDTEPTGKDDNLIVKTADVEYVTLYPKEECA